MENEKKKGGRKKKEIDMCFANKLTSLLDKAKAENGTIQADVAESVGVSRQALGKWASGETVPDILDLKKLAKRFNVSADYLIGLSDVPSPDTDMQGVCKYTGLSKNAVTNIGILCEEEHNYKFRNNVTNCILGGYGFVSLMSSVAELVSESDDYNRIHSQLESASIFEGSIDEYEKLSSQQKRGLFFEDDYVDLLIKMQDKERVLNSLRYELQTRFSNICDYFDVRYKKQAMDRDRILTNEELYHLIDSLYDKEDT